MKKIFSAILCVACLCTSCNFLDQPAYGVLGEDNTDAEKLCIAAYAGVGNDEINRPISFWGYGNVRADDAYKGGNDINDGEWLHYYEICSPALINEGNWFDDGWWYNNYCNISRINLALRALNEQTDETMPNRTTRIAEMRFLRAHVHFVLKVVFKHIPYITENMTTDEISQEPNRGLSSDEVWQKIIDDLEFAYNNLPPQQDEVGRANKYAAAAYCAKAYLYKAYRQDEMNNVVEINKDELGKVVSYADEVIKSPYGLEPDFANNFLPGEYENGKESLFAIQYSREDGTTWGRLNKGCALTTPTPGGDFNKPSQSLVNAFITKNGLPDFDGYNKADYDEATDKVDPRLFHTVAIPGKPYKYTNITFENNDALQITTARNAALYGNYSSLKENVDPQSEYNVKTGPWFANSKNWIVLRYADVLLFKAEALVELDRHDEALPIVNELRSRAKESMGRISWATNADIALYENGTNCTWDKEYARQAVRWERRLEMAMEGYRFFDLVRWGVADEVMNSFYAKEKAAHSYYNAAEFVKNKFEYAPIPTKQINFSKGVYQQNYGWDR